MNETAQAASGDPGLLPTLFPIFLLVAVIYFIMIRPQQKRNKQHRQMLGELQKGDEIVTIGGMVGRVTRIADEHVTVCISGNTEVSFQKQAIQSVLPKGTIDSI